MLPINGFSSKQPKVKLLAGEQKAAEVFQRAQYRVGLLFGSGKIFGLALPTYKWKEQKVWLVILGLKSETGGCPLSTQHLALTITQFGIPNIDPNELGLCVFVGTCCLFLKGKLCCYKLPVRISRLRDGVPWGKIWPEGRCFPKPSGVPCGSLKNKGGPKRREPRPHAHEFRKTWATFWESD